MSVIVIMFAIIFLLNLPPIINQILTSISFLFTIIVTISVIFISKIIYLFQGNDMNAHLSLNYNNNNKNKAKNQSQISPKKYSQKFSQLNIQITESISKEELKILKNTLNGLHNSEKLKLCLKNINIWNDLLMKIGDSNEVSNENDNKNENENINDNENENEMEIWNVRGIEEENVNNERENENNDRENENDMERDCNKKDVDSHEHIHVYREPDLIIASYAYNDTRNSHMFNNSINQSIFGENTY